MQNTSHAVMAQRIESADSPDDFPTPPWATRALLEHVLSVRPALQHKTCLEPACGAGHMTRPLADYFGTVHASDAYDYGYGPVRDFLIHLYEDNSVDWVITNPPFRHSEQFVIRALDVAREGIAIPARTTFIESVERYRNLLCDTPPSKFARHRRDIPRAGEERCDYPCRRWHAESTRTASQL